MRKKDVMKRMFMRAEDVAEVMDVSVSYAYKLIRRLNEELREKGFITIRGRIDREYFYDHFYSELGKGGCEDAGV